MFQRILMIVSEMIGRGGEAGLYLLIYEVVEVRLRPVGGGGGGEGGHTQHSHSLTANEYNNEDILDTFFESFRTEHFFMILLQPNCFTKKVWGLWARFMHIQQRS